MNRKPSTKDNNIFIILGVFVFIAFVTVIILNTYQRPKVSVAFVIDDWGYNVNNIDLVFQIDRPITLAVLPNLRYSNFIMKRVKEDGPLCDVILHLPMESKSGKLQEQNTIKCSMKEKDIVAILENDIEELPDVIGVSNHQGSKATEDKKLMRVIFGELKKRKLFFLDSRTTSASVCSDVAGNIGLVCAERDIFLDLAEKKSAKQYKSYVRKQINKLIGIARQKRSAIGIGHDNKFTLEVIKESIPEIEKQNIRVVPLKQLVREK